MALQGVVNLIQPQTQERRQDFDVSLSGVDEEELLGDALRLNQILINILSNAVKFTPAGGSIRLEVRQIYKKNNSVRFRFIIRDTGIGMSKEFVERLYTPFEQATSSIASKFGGTGLGMAITKNLVSLLGGTIFVKSEEGRGTEFTVELPDVYKRQDHPRAAFDRDQLLERVWGYDYAGETRTVDVHVRTLRQKLGEAASCIETVRGVGYRLAAEWSPGGLRHEDGPSPEQKRTDTDTSGGRPAGA